MNDDVRDLRAARAAFNARKTDSSLIAWVCSEEWTDPGNLVRVSTERKLESERVPRYDGPERGSVYCASGLTYARECTSGEINAYTRDHVDPFQGGEGL